MKLPHLILAAVILAVTSAAAASSPYPIHRQHQRGETLTIEHTPVRTVAVRRVRRGKVALSKRRVRRAKAVVSRRSNRVIGSILSDERVFWTGAIAGGCRSGGFVRRRIAGTPVTLQREVCGSIAPGHFARSDGGIAGPRRAGRRVVRRSPRS